jgi:hypothetical protein
VTFSDKDAAFVPVYIHCKTILCLERRSCNYFAVGDGSSCEELLLNHKPVVSMIWPPAATKHLHWNNLAKSADLGWAMPSSDVCPHSLLRDMSHRSGVSHYQQTDRAAPPQLLERPFEARQSVCPKDRRCYYLNFVAAAEAEAVQVATEVLGSYLLVRRGCA